jgi:hypothetical protein
MILPVLRELSQLCRVPKLDDEQRESAYILMRRLRENGFTNHELFVFSRGKFSEPSIKRNTRGVEVRETLEHDDIIERLSDFIDGGYEISDIEGYKESRAALDDAKLTFDECTRFAKDLLILGVDAPGLVEFADELTGENLTAKSIRKNIDLNEKLATNGITVEIQLEILEASKNFGDPFNILEGVNASGGLRAIASETAKAKDELVQVKARKDQLEREKERIENEGRVYKSYVEVAKLLLVKYSFDLSSLDELVQLAGKHGSALGVIRAVNYYNGEFELQSKLRDAQIRLRIIEDDLANKEVALKNREESLAKANSLLGEIKANQAQSFRLQIVSDLIMKPKEAKAKMTEIAGICLILLLGVRDFSESHREESDKFIRKVGSRLSWTIEDLQEFLR